MLNRVKTDQLADANTREPHPEDRRVSLIAVSAEVSRYARRAPARLASPLARALEGAPAAERKRFIQTLKRLAELVGAS